MPQILASAEARRQQVEQDPLLATGMEASMTWGTLSWSLRRGRSMTTSDDQPCVEAIHDIEHDMRTSTAGYS